MEDLTDPKCQQYQLEKSCPWVYKIHLELTTSCSARILQHYWGGGGWVKQVTGTCRDEQQRVMCATAEPLYYTPETNMTLRVN